MSVESLGVGREEASERDSNVNKNRLGSGCLLRLQGNEQEKEGCSACGDGWPCPAAGRSVGLKGKYERYFSKEKKNRKGGNAKQCNMQQNHRAPALLLRRSRPGTHRPQPKQQFCVGTHEINTLQTLDFKAQT